MKRRIRIRRRDGIGQRYWVGKIPKFYPSGRFIDPLGLTKKEHKKYDQRLDKLEAEGVDIGPLVEYEMDLAPGPSRSDIQKYLKQQKSKKNYGSFLSKPKLKHTHQAVKLGFRHQIRDESGLGTNLQKIQDQIYPKSYRPTLPKTVREVIK